jgi:pantoate--beta-alanine ligase
MIVAKTRAELRIKRHELIVAYHKANLSRPVVGIVPTMGALHAGHSSLIEHMVRECDLSVVTIFINPAQFAPGEDYDTYPRTLDNDLRVCEQAGVHLVFAPGKDEMYPADYQTTVRVAGLAEQWCGAARPGHFDGVTTVVSKLFGLIQPDRAYFGQKDYQQYRVIERMAIDLELSVDIVPCEIEREPDGLALSSRNRYLSPAERAAAPRIYQALTRMQELFAEGEREVARLIASAGRLLNDGPGPLIKLEYFAVVHPRSLQARETAEPGDRVLIATRLGKTRLIDNVPLEG